MQVYAVSASEDFAVSCWIWMAYTETMSYKVCAQFQTTFDAIFKASTGSRLKGNIAMVLK